MMNSMNRSHTLSNINNDNNNDSNSNSNSNSCWYLHALELCNWGEFCGKQVHRAEFALENLPSEVGAIVQAWQLEGAEMALVSVFDALLGEQTSSRQMVQRYVSCGASPSAIAAHFRKSSEETLVLAATFEQDGEAAWFFALNEPNLSLESLLSPNFSASQYPALHRHASRSTYLARVQSFFGISASASTLISRAAQLDGIKSLEQVIFALLPDTEAAYQTSRAQSKELLSDLEHLEQEHAKLEQHKREYLALLPLQELEQQIQEQQEELEQWQQLELALPAWIAGQGQALWHERIEQLQKSIGQLRGHIAQAEAELEQAQLDEQAALERYFGSGAGHIELLRAHLEHERQNLSQRQSALQEYLALTQDLDLPPPESERNYSANYSANYSPDNENALVLNAENLSAHQRRVQEVLDQLEQRLEKNQIQLESAIAAAHQQAQRVQTLQTELSAAQSGGTNNLPQPYQEFRAALAEHLQLKPKQLPFVAELVQVPPSEQEWRGAIERALGGQRLRLLVPQGHMAAALQWVNTRYQHLHIRLLEALPPRPGLAPVEFWEDGIVNKLELRPHALQPALRQLLAQHDRHCVDSPQELHATPHAITREGLMSGQAWHFDKNDNRLLEHDQLLGFDNRDRVHQLSKLLAEAQTASQALERSKEAALERGRHLRSQRRRCRQLLACDFPSLDVARSHAKVARLELQIEALLAPDSSTARHHASWQEAQQLRMHIQERLSKQTLDLALLQQDLSHAQNQRDYYAKRSERLAQQQPAQWEERFLTLLEQAPPALALPAAPQELSCQALPTQERKLLIYAGQQRAQHQYGLQQIYQDVLAQMSQVQKRPSIHRLRACLERLQQLQEQELPRLRQDFERQLQSMSAQRLLNWLDSVRDRAQQYVAHIEQLGRSAGLELGAELKAHSTLTTLEEHLAHLRLYQHEGSDASEHYQAMHLLHQWLISVLGSDEEDVLLDPCQRIALTPATTAALAPAQSASAAARLLAASLGASLARLGSVAIGKLYSRSSQGAAQELLSGLLACGLRPLLATGQGRHIGLLDQYAPSAALIVVHDAVHDESKTAHKELALALVSLSWQELLQE